MIYNTILSILVLVAITSVVSIIVLPVLSLVFAPVKHFMVTKIGNQTTGTVIRSQRCDDSEDVCVCGVYSYQDQLKWEHKVKFRCCWHWPSNEEWEIVIQQCGSGAENTVYYLPWLPFIHEIQWNFDKKKTDEPLESE
jgi:hypothetical protein